MIRAVLCIIILAAGIGSGYLAARPYKNRVIHLQDLMLVLRIMEAEMEYRSEPLPQLMDRLAITAPGKAGDFLLSVLSFLAKEEQYDFYSSWEKAVNHVYRESALTSEDLDIVIHAGIELGKTDMENQRSMFAHLFKGLERQRNEAEKDQKTRERVYRALGSASGAMAVILLL